MNISDIARTQRMMYQFVNRSVGNGYESQFNARMYANYGLGMSEEESGDEVVDMLRSIGISGTEGRTFREIAQNRMKALDKRDTGTASEAAELDASSLAQRFSVRERYTPISDEATEAMQKLALEDAKNSVRSVKPDQAGRANLIREQLRDVDPSKRTASFNTMNKVWESELDRIGSYIQEKDPGWTGWGSQFDTAILEDYKAGVNIWI